jgi:lysozyme
MSSTLLKRHKAGDYARAGDEFLRWNRGNGKVMPGLTKRRAAERQLYLS